MAKKNNISRLVKWNSRSFTYLQEYRKKPSGGLSYRSYSLLPSPYIVILFLFLYISKRSNVQCEFDCKFSLNITIVSV